MWKFASIVTVVLGIKPPPPPPKSVATRHQPLTESRLVEMYEIQRRNRTWSVVEYQTSGEAVRAEDLDLAPPGWTWATEWILDSTSGWEYFRSSGTRWRRRRWVRILRPVPPPQPKKRPRRRKVVRPPPPPVESPFAVAAVKEEVVLKKEEALPAILDEYREILGRTRSQLQEKWIVLRQRISDDFTFRGFGLGASVAAFGVKKRTAAIVFQMPLSPNFASWERRSTYLPMVSALLVAYPKVSAVDAVMPGSFVVAVVFSFSYPLDALRRGLHHIATRPGAWLSLLTTPPEKRRKPERRTDVVKLGARSVQRIGFSLSSRVAVSPLEGKISGSAIQLRPWFMYAPGLRLLASLLESFVVAVANLVRLAFAPDEPAAYVLLNASNATSNASDVNRSTTKNITIPQTQKGKKSSSTASSRSLLGSVKAWFDAKTTVLGLSFLPVEADLYRTEAAVEPPKPWRGSVIFMMRPFFPLRPASSPRRPTTRSSSSVPVPVQ